MDFDKAFFICGGWSDPVRDGLYYMRARYYSTDLKRFVNEDTVLGGIMNGQTLNRFSYVNGNPVSYIDPTGHVFFLPVLAGMAVAGESAAIATGLGIIGSTLAMAAASVLGNVIGDAIVETVTTDKTSSGNSKSQDNIAKADSGNGGGRSANDLKPDPKAQGDHTTFKRDPTTGKITNYETWKKADPRNPNPYESETRFDGTGKPHTNKVTEEKLMPHVHDKTVPGDVRAPYSWDLPLGY